MKNSLRALSPAFLLASIVASPAMADRVSLFDFTVYTKNGITSQRSDIQGLTGSGGDIYLQDFEIHRTRASQADLRRAVYGASVFSLKRGAVIARDARGRDVIGGVEARRVILSRVADVNVRETDEFSVDHRNLAREMDDASARLAFNLPFANAHTVVKNNVFSSAGRGTINVFDVDGRDLEAADIVLNGSRRDIFIINVKASAMTASDGSIFRGVQLDRKGIFLDGDSDIGPSNIIWNFYDADGVLITKTGVDRNDPRRHWGLPGTILAPRAKVVFSESLITGAIFAAELTNLNMRDGSTYNGGQTNDACFNGGSTGLGCGATPPPCPPDEKGK